VSDVDAEDREAFLVGLVGRSLEQYEAGALALPALVSEVEATVTALFEVADPRWVDRLRTAWSGLEIIHAVMLDEDRTVPLKRIARS
jgi:hypothetical protein